MTFIEVDIGAYVLWIPTSQSWMLQKSAAPWMKVFFVFWYLWVFVEGLFSWPQLHAWAMDKQTRVLGCTWSLEIGDGWGGLSW